MHFAYYDESGDDGYPAHSSNLFVLTALYLHFTGWPDALERLLDLRRQLKAQYSLPVKVEFHTSSFLKKKRPFTGYTLSNDQRLQIITDFCGAIAALRARVVNVCIVKDRITSAGYDVLDTAFKYSIQRVHNDLHATNPDHKFLIITDEGRHVVMARTARRIRRYNIVPSQYGAPRDIRIATLLEDPLPKESQRSFFVQAADVIAFVVYLYTSFEIGQGMRIARRLRYISQSQVSDWMKALEPVLNTNASAADPYGVVIHPR